MRLEGKIVLCVAPSGIAALLLPGGRTVHNRFKLNLDLESCNIKLQSQLADLIRQADLIIWDEAPMMNIKGFETVEYICKKINDFYS